MGAPKALLPEGVGWYTMLMEADGDMGCVCVCVRFVSFCCSRSCVALCFLVYVPVCGHGC